MNRPFLAGRQTALLLHLLVILLVLFLPLILMSGTIESAGNFLGRFYLRVGLYGLFFYSCYLFLVPALYIKGRRLLFFFVVMAATLVLYFADDYLSQLLFPDHDFKLVMETVMGVLAERGVFLKPPSREFHAVGFITLNLLLAGSALGLKLANTLAQKEKMQKELEKQHLSTELSMLKNQISPHFFFNTLNNIYSLTEIDTAAAQQAILKLSRLMRYLLYETNHESAPLQREVDFLTDYIDLMRLRLSERVVVSVSLPANCDSAEVPPLLFIPFVENAFKHGISYREPSFIRVTMECRAGGIHFRCANSRFDQQEALQPQGGFGLDNVRKRLDLIYGKGYDLQIESAANEYHVLLHIQSKSSKP